MKTLHLKYNPMHAVASNITDQELIRHIAHEFPELPLSLVVLINRFDAASCGVRNSRDPVTKKYLSTGPH